MQLPGGRGEGGCDDGQNKYSSDYGQEKCRLVPRKTSFSTSAIKMCGIGQEGGGGGGVDGQNKYSSDDGQEKRRLV